jgi:hypothetical protein
MAQMFARVRQRSAGYLQGERRLQEASRFARRAQELAQAAAAAR